MEDQLNGFTVSTNMQMNLFPKPVLNFINYFKCFKVVFTVQLLFVKAKICRWFMEKDPEQEANNLILNQFSFNRNLSLEPAPLSFKVTFLHGNTVALIHDLPYKCLSF